MEMHVTQAIAIPGHVTVGHVLHGQDHVMQEIATLGHVTVGQPYAM